MPAFCPTAGALGAFKAAQYLRGVITTPRCADPLLPLVDNEIDAIRTSVAAALEAKGCTHILLPDEHRALVEGRPGAAPDVGGSTTV